MPLIVRDYLLYSGDHIGVLHRLPELKQRLLEFLVRNDNLLYGSEEIREVLDWPLGERDGYETEQPMLVPQCYRVAALAAMAELTGEMAYVFRSQELVNVIRARFQKNGRFVDHPGSLHTAQHSLFFPLIFGVATPEEVAELRGQEIRCSVYAAQFLLDAAWSAGWNDYAYSLLTGNGMRSWLHMIDTGSTISTEAWDNSLKPNQDWNHAWGAAPANLIPRRLCGIRPVAPGFTRFTVDPRPAQLEYFRSKHPTPNGPIEVEFDSGSLHVSFPEGMTAECAGKSYSAPFSVEPGVFSEAFPSGIHTK